MDKLTVAHFSMEAAVDPAIPTYNGGSGILAGDTLRAVADLSVPMIGMTLLYHKGYSRQHLDERGNQTEIPIDWAPDTNSQVDSGADCCPSKVRRLPGWNSKRRNQLSPRWLQTYR
jgi:glucan phosphorylase